MARVTDIITTIVEGGKDSPESVTVDSTSWGTTDGTITLSASVPSTVNIGDVINDSNGNSYLITGISGSDLTCQDFDTTTDPATGSATIDSAYTSITLWEADLDAGTNSEAYVSGDAAIGHVYNTGGAFDESFTIDGGGTVGLSSVTLTAPESERHDGTSNSAAKISNNPSFGASLIHIGSSPKPTTVEWLILEVITTSNESSRNAVRAEQNGKDIIRNCVIPGDSRDGTGSQQNGIYGYRDDCIALNNIIYGTNTTNSSGVFFDSPSEDSVARNNTIYDCAEGINIDEVVTTVQNNLCVGNTTDYTGSPNTANNNLDSDSTAPGTSSQTSDAATEFADTTAGMEDLHLKSGATAIDNGADLGTTDGVEVDIDNRDRDAEGDTWDIGAYEFVATGTDVDVSTSDAVAVSELLDVIRANARDASTSDSVTVGEQVAVLLKSMVDVSDSVTVGEDVSTVVESFINISDSVTVTDLPFYYPDLIAVTEDLTVEIVTPDGALTFNVNDSVSVSEALTAIIQSYVDVSDGVSVGESLTSLVESFIDTSDSVTVAETVQALLVHLASVSDSVTIGESVTGQVQVTVDVSDSVSVGESLVATLISLVSINDSVSVAESVATILVSLISVSDGVTVGEATTLTVDDPLVSISDSVTIAETVTITVLQEGVIALSVADGVTVGELTDVNVVIDLNAIDSVSVAESVSTLLQSFVSLSDSAAVTESLNTLLVSLIDLQDQVSVAESVSMDVDDPTINISDSITVNDSLTVSIPGVTVLAEAHLEPMGVIRRW